MVKYDPSIISILDLRKTIRDLGYDVESEGEIDKLVEEMRNARKRMLMAWAFIIPIILWIIPEVIFDLAWPNQTAYNLSLIHI